MSTAAEHSLCIPKVTEFCTIQRMYNLVTDPKPRKPLSLYESWQITKRKQKWQKGLLDYWQATAERQTGIYGIIDELIMPVAPCAASPHDTNECVGCHCSFWNLSDRPSLTFPVTTVDPKVDVKEPLHSPFSDEDQHFYDLYNPDSWKGMPVNLQLVGPRQHDEQVLGLGHVLIRAGVAINE